MIPIRQAMLMELRLNNGRFGTAIVLCVLCLVLAATVTDALVAVLPIWAALAWYRYGRADTASRAELRASLGLSRAVRLCLRAQRPSLPPLPLFISLLLVPPPSRAAVPHSLRDPEGRGPFPGRARSD